MVLRAYKLIHDTGFAPNPFGSALTLVTCKPGIRLVSVPGDWIAGFTSGLLNGDLVGAERLIYLMQVGVVMPLDHYFVAMPDKRFAEDPIERRCGDAIYRRDATGGWEQVPNPFHGRRHLDRDVRGTNALIARRFAYFGSSPLTVENDVRPDVPKASSRYGAITIDEARVRAFVDYVFSHGEGRVGLPHCWPPATRENRVK